MTGVPLTERQRARATAALEVFYANPGGSTYRAPGFHWTSRDLDRMHAALEAPDLDAALGALDIAPGSWLSTPEQDRENRELLAAVRCRIGGNE